AHLAAFDAQVADVSAAFALAESGVAGVALWERLSPSLQADLRLRAAIGGAVGRLEGLEREARGMKEVGAGEWAASAVASERVVVDAELTAELVPALARRAAFAASLTDEAQAVQAGETPRLTTSLAGLGDYGFWPGTPRPEPTGID
nr:hypothetical protein [Deltaproteobacteria bacterium]